MHAKIDGVPAGQHPMVSRLMQGIFNTRPSKPHYTLVWDVEMFLDHIKNMWLSMGNPGIWNPHAIRAMRVCSVVPQVQNKLSNSSFCHIHVNEPFY